jgi:serine/threonine-protein kinase
VLPALPPRYDPNLELLGRGGFGAVYRTWDHDLSRPVAVKVLFQGGGRDLARASAVELRAAATLRHPNIAQAIDAGSCADGSPFLVMQYAAEGSLAGARLDEPRTWPELLSLLDGILAGLAHAHAAGVVHRDIKPENILLARDRERRLVPLISDFGLAKLRSPRGSFQSTRMVAGTLLYMPPEQFESDASAVQPAADLYAFGFLLFRLASGDFPWDPSGELAVLLSKATREPPQMLPRPGAGLPAGLTALVARLLDPDPARRFQLAAELRRELGSLGQPRASPRLPVSQGRGSGGGPSSNPDSPPAPPRSRLPERPDPVPEAEDFPPTPALAAFRVPRLVDREAERARLWTCARRAEGGPLGLAMLGASGMGRSRLCEWLGGALEEGGIARVVPIRLDAVLGLDGSLQRAVRGQMALGNLRGSELRRRAEAWTAARGPGSPGLAEAVCRWLEADERGAGAGEGEALSISGSVERRLALLEQLLRLEAPGGLAVTWIEDPGPLGDGAAFAQELLRAARAAPFPLLLLYEPPGQGSQRAAGEAGAERGAQPGVPEGFESLVVGPLEPEALVRLVCDLLPGNLPDAPKVIAEQALGSARLAVEWVRLHAVRLDAGRPEAAPAPASAPEPASAREFEPTLSLSATGLAGRLGEARLAAFVAALAGRDAGRASLAERALAAVALLPRPCAPRLLGAACALRDGDAALAEVIDEARLHGLLVAAPDGALDVPNPELRAAALSRLDRGTQGAAIRLACGRALLAGDLGGRPAVRACAAGLLLDGGQASEALPLLLDAAPRLMARDLAAARNAWEAALRAADALGLPATEARRADAVLGAASAARNAGQLDEAAALLARLDPSSLEPADRARFLQVRASLAVIRGELDSAVADARAARADSADLRGLARAAQVEAEALDRMGRRADSAAALEAALELARAAGSAEDELECLRRQARLLRAQGQRQEVREAFEGVLAMARHLSDQRVEGMALRELGNLSLFARRSEDAERLLRDAARKLEEAGCRAESIVTRISLGELARASGRAQEARREYSAALAAARAYGIVGTATVALWNLAITELGQDSASRAARRMEELDQLVPPGTPGRYRPQIEVLRLAVRAATGDWAAAEKAMDGLFALEVEIPADADIVFLLDSAAEKAALAGETPLASDAWDLARRLAERSDDGAAAARIRERLAGLMGA